MATMTKDEIKNALYSLHHSTFRNEKQVKNSKVCGCFYCGSIFRPEDVEQWCDEDGDGDPTALCPRCGIDSVIGDACGVNVTPAFLHLMNAEFFGSGIEDLNITVVKGDDQTAS